MSAKSVDIEITMECKECGRELGAELTFNQRGYITATVEPCPDCIAEAVSEIKEGVLA